MNRITEIRIRRWVFIEESKSFGPGRYELLENIAGTVSISKAATADLRAFLAMVTDSSFVNNPAFSNPQPVLNP